MRIIRTALPLALAAGMSACATTAPDPLLIPPVALQDSPPALPAAAYEPVFDPARLDSHVKTLSDDSFEGRAPATAGETKTVAYIVQQLTAAGAEPGGEVINGQRQ